MINFSKASKQASKQASKFLFIENIKVVSYGLCSMDTPTAISFL